MRRGRYGPASQVKSFGFNGGRRPMRLQHFAACPLRSIKGLHVISVCRKVGVDLPGHRRLPRGQPRAMDEPREVIGHVDEFEPCMYLRNEQAALL